MFGIDIQMLATHKIVGITIELSCDTFKIISLGFPNNVTWRASDTQVCNFENLFKIAQIALNALKYLYALKWAHINKQRHIRMRNATCPSIYSLVKYSKPFLNAG